jgi:hypothetical protein
MMMKGNRGSCSLKGTGATGCIIILYEGLPVPCAPVRVNGCVDVYEFH